jgi:hypothetical protein
MANRLSDLLNVKNEELERLGVFDGFIDIDSHLHIDPSLLKTCSILEFENSYEKFLEYFEKVLALVVNHKRKGDALWRQAHQRLMFKEIGNNALGYSKKGTSGSAIGPKLAENILTTVALIVEAGIKDPVIFELVPFFEEGIGADRISDMTQRILVREFFEFSQRVATSLNAKTKTIKYGDIEFQLPFNPKTGKSIILVPKSLLNDLPIARSWDDIDRVSRYNSELRARVSGIIGRNWKAASRVAKSLLKKTLIDNPEILKDLVQQYKEKPLHGYDFLNDPLGEIVWGDLAKKAPVDYPLNLSDYHPITPENILSVVKLICEQYGSLIENNGWFEYLYNEKGNLKPERASQLLFYGIAETYCIANNLDLNREINSGIGSLDFKISRGFKAKVNVEIKYSTNTNLIKGFEKQLPAYNKAEKTDTSIYLVIQTKIGRKNIDELIKLANIKRSRGEKVPEIILIDGQKQLSASKRR